MLRRCKDPRKKGVKLTSHGDGFLTKGNRWFVEAFSGDDGENYERARRQWGHPVVKWFIIALD